MFSRVLRSRRAIAAFAFGTGTVFAVKSTALSETNAFFGGPPPLPKDAVAQVRRHVEAVLEEHPEAGPEFVRLAWHASGSYNRKEGNGGNHGTMDMEPESKDPGNAGLHVPRKHLAALPAKTGMSKADVWVLASLVAIAEMGGPTIPFYYGRTDASKCPPTGRLPDATQGEDHIRAVFTGQYGFNDQEIVALIGAHALGRCHLDRSGFEGPWTNDPYGFSNNFFVELLEKHWVPKTVATGNKQFEDYETKKLMMLPSDMALLRDEKFLPWVKKYADDNDLFCEHFSKAYVKLTNLSWSGLGGPITDY